MFRSLSFFLVSLFLLVGCASPGGAPAATPVLLVGTDPAPWAPAPGDEQLKRGEASIEVDEILVLEVNPPQFFLDIRGTMPTPCHYLRAKVSEPDSQNRIEVEVYTLVNPDEICTQVLQPFEAQIPLMSTQKGVYSVYLNGEKVGDFSV